MLNNKRKMLLKQALMSGKFAKVTTGIFRDNQSTIWKVEVGEDGLEYIVRTDLQEGNVVEASGDWEVVSDREQTSVTAFYKNIPIQKFEAQVYDFDRHSIRSFEKVLLRKLSDKKFVQKIVKTQSVDYQKHLKRQCPELFE